MIYVLQHSKNAQMHSAKDKEQVSKWSLRQLGERSKLSSISENKWLSELCLIEKGGTGITNEITSSCQSMLNVTSAHSEALSNYEMTKSLDKSGRATINLRIRDATIH